VNLPPRRAPGRIGKIGVVGHPRYAALHATLDRAIAFARDRGIEVLVHPELLTPEDRSVERLGVDALNELDLLLTLGGDGTLLRGARAVAPFGVPVLGVNLGHLGFLTSLAPEELEAGLEAVVAGTIVLDDRLVLSVSAAAPDGSVHGTWLALNDAVLHRGGVARMIRMAISVRGEEVGTYSADGIIIATPTGSTAYSLSAGGPIVSPSVECIVASPICPHTLAVRPLVLPAGDRVHVEVLTPTEELILTIDGQEGAHLLPGDSLVIERAAARLCLVRFPGQTFFSTLRRKLRWGGMEERER
jgi:NAD+ kinase